MPRVMPCLLLEGDRLVKTVKFSRPTYIGDPINAVRIFNELEVDELVFLDISASRDGRGPTLDLVAEIARECFMPFAYGGGVRSVEDARALFKVGVEKVVINTAAYERPEFIKELVELFGSQAVVLSIDVKRGIFGKYSVINSGSRKRVSSDVVGTAKWAESLGAGEILLTSIDRDGTWIGYDVELIRAVTDSVSIPVVASGGAGKVEHITEAFQLGGASGCALGSMVVYQNKGLGVLIQFPNRAALATASKKL